MFPKQMLMLVWEGEEGMRRSDMNARAGKPHQITIKWEQNADQENNYNHKERKYRIAFHGLLKNHRRPAAKAGLAVAFLEGGDTSRCSPTAQQNPMG